MAEQHLAVAGEATPRPSRANSARPSSSSSRLICMLTADWVRWTRCAAAVKLPVSAMATKLRRSSGSKVASIGRSIRECDE